jgi:Rrf2 family protein
MRVNTKIRYGLRMLVQLARTEGVVNTAELGKQMEVSPKYLRKLAGPLEKSGLIRSVQGIHGGYILNQDSSEISIQSLFAAFDENIELSNCMKMVDCSLIEDCSVRPVWEYLQGIIEKEFLNITVDDILNGSFGSKG